MPSLCVLSRAVIAAWLWTLAGAADADHLFVNGTLITLTEDARQRCGGLSQRIATPGRVVSAATPRAGRGQ